ncbi:RNA polymerase sigma factor [Echinicola jeungdonensis]|uniref:RNA polymerase sigma factor n=1 Tax=Echinicola jeungdonensis TaxID=709343 RepID=A0ABV5J3A4_9BACT|nr:RNA polymerase sigma factor [Echinicola jeungdonensis]MDN3668920.1 RNA polymerase sigma factor [Echinicola jeungdonensis]
MMKEPRNNRLHLSKNGKEVEHFHDRKILMVYAEKSDFEVWSAFKLGDEAAFNYIYRQYMNALYNYAYQVSRDQDLARDAIHTLFIKIRRKRKELPEVHNIKAYLMKIIYRLILDALKQKQKSHPLIENPHDNLFPVELSPESQMINQEVSEEKRSKLEDALNQLSKRQREALLLMYREELSYKEIAEILELEHVKSARKLIYRAVAKMRAILVTDKNS